MKFWKFEYPGSAELTNCINSKSLPPRESTFPGLVNTHDYPIKSMKTGDSVFLAKLVGDEAKFFAIGVVQSIDDTCDEIVVQWAATQFTRFPNAQGGLKHWQTKSAFEIKPEPAKRYGLAELITYYVKC